MVGSHLSLFRIKAYIFIFSMIIWVFFFLISVSTLFYGRSVINLITIILSMSLCLSILFFLKRGTVLALIWLLVYLGGIMVCFVYILFIVYSRNLLISSSFQTVHVCARINLLILVIKLFLLIDKSSFNTNFWSNVSLDVMTFSEAYLQLASLSSSRFLFLSFILTIRVVQILSILQLKAKAQNVYLI